MPAVTAVFARLSVTLPVNAPPPDIPVPAITFTVFGTAPVTLATGIVMPTLAAFVIWPCALTVI